jgi:hypothetical protein
MLSLLLTERLVISYLSLMLDPEVTVMLEASPGFIDRYLDLAEAADGDPGVAATLTELADYVAGLAAEIERVTPVLARCLDGVESVAASSEEAAELVAWAFLDSLSPDDRRRLGRWLGPRTRALLHEVDPDPGSRP